MSTDGSLIHRRDGDWHVFVRADETEILRIKLPPGGFTVQDWERLRAFLLNWCKRVEA